LESKLLVVTQELDVREQADAVAVPLILTVAMLGVPTLAPEGLVRFTVKALVPEKGAVLKIGTLMFFTEVSPFAHVSTLLTLLKSTPLTAVPGAVA
jgi:hypothetical protein